MPGSLRRGPSQSGQGAGGAQEFCQPEAGIMRAWRLDGGPSRPAQKSLAGCGLQPLSRPRVANTPHFCHDRSPARSAPTFPILIEPNRRAPSRYRGMLATIAGW